MNLNRKGKAATFFKKKDRYYNDYQSFTSN